MYGVENIGILPNNQQNPLDLYREMQRQQQEQERYQQQLKQQQDHYNDQLLAGLANRLDFKDFATGTVFDPVFQHNLDAVLKGIAETLKNGGSYADALMMAMRTAGEVGNYSGLIKKKRAEIDAAAKNYEKDLSIDADALRRQALTRYLFNPDHTLKDTTQLADDNDYVTSILENSPELVTKGLGSLYDQVEKGKYIPYKGEITRDEGGIKRVTAYEGKYDPLYNDLVNGKGEVVTDNTATGVRVKTVPIKIGDRQVPGVSEDVLNHFYQNPGTRAGIRAEARKLMPSMPQGTKQSDVERYILHRELTNSANSYINKTKDDYDTSQLQAQNFTRAMRELAAAARAQKEKEGTVVKDIFSPLVEAVDKAAANGKVGLAANAAAPEAQQVITDYLNDQVRSTQKLGNSDYYLRSIGKGRVGLYLTGEVAHTLGRHPFVGELTDDINYLANPKDRKTVQGMLTGTAETKTVTQPKVSRPQNGTKSSNKNNDPLGLGL